MITTLESMILRNVLDGERTRGVTVANRTEHDAAVMDLINRGLISYNPRRQAQRFALTVHGRAALDEAERHPTVRLNGKVFAPWERP